MTLVRTSFSLTAALLVAAFTISMQAQMKKSWTEEDYDKLMKEVGATAGASRKAIEGQNAEMLKTNADKLETLFTEVQAFWQSRNVKEAATIAGDAMKHAAAVESAADAKDFTKAAESMKMLQGNCAGCHSQYRDKGPDGNWRIKPM